MKKKILIIVLPILAMDIGLVFILSMLFAQYNPKGISHYLVITLDKEQPNEYIGVLDNHNVYIEGLNIKETNFRSVEAENISIKYAIENNLVSINEWKRYAWSRKRNKDSIILKYENYEIYIDSKDCIIRPLTY